MSIQFIRHQFLELFDKEIIGEEELLGEYTYSITIDEFNFILFMVQADEYVAITLRYKNYSSYIFNLFFENISAIKIEKKNDTQIFLNFYRRGKDEPLLSIIIKPTISIHFQEPC